MQARAIILVAVVAACTSEPLSSVKQAVQAPMIEDAFDCAPPDPGSNNAGELQRATIPTNVYSDAKCNDGTNAVLYFRPGRNDGRNSWLIELEGTGMCRTPEECAYRYCNQRDRMSSSQEPVTMNASGIQSLTRGPFKDYNHVFIHYCSSDMWSGDSLSEGTAEYPENSGQQVTFRTRFRGAVILDAALQLLRGDRVSLPIFTLDGLPFLTMPDLDDATGRVIIAGGSAGGFGVEGQLDRLVQGLTANRTPSTPPFYAGFIDSAFPPNLEDLEFKYAAGCTQPCTWKKYIEQTSGYFTPVRDATCENTHPTQLYMCTDFSHVVRYHLMTPFFIRQDSTDWLLSDKYQNDWKLATSSSSTGPMTVDEFAVLVRAQAQTLSGAFVPDCSQHDPLHDSPAFFDTSVGSYTWENVWANWLTMTATPRVLIDTAIPQSISGCY